MKLSVLFSTNSTVVLHFVSWRKTQENEASPTYYILQYKEDKDKEWVDGVKIKHDDISTVVTATQAGLTSGRVYNFQAVPVYVDSNKKAHHGNPRT